MPITQYLVAIILLLLWLKFGAFADDPKKKAVKIPDYDYILHNIHDKETRIINTTYHKYLMVKGGKRLIHLKSCKNKTHIKN